MKAFLMSNSVIVLQVSPSASLPKSWKNNSSILGEQLSRYRPSGLGLDLTIASLDCIRSMVLCPPLKGFVIDPLSIHTAEQEAAILEQER